VQIHKKKGLVEGDEEFLKGLARGAGDAPVRVDVAEFSAHTQEQWKEAVADTALVAANPSKLVAANPSRKHFIEIWAALEAGGHFVPFDGHIRGFNHEVASARLSGIFDLQTP